MVSINTITNIGYTDVPSTRNSVNFWEVVPSTVFRMFRQLFGRSVNQKRRSVNQKRLTELQVDGTSEPFGFLVVPSTKKWLTELQVDGMTEPFGI